MPDPSQIAMQESARIHAEGISSRAKRQAVEDDADYPAYWQGYDTARGQHTIQRLGQNATTNATSVSSGGHQPGQSIDIAYSANYTAIDTMPYVQQARPTVQTQTRRTIQLAYLIYETREIIPSSPAEDNTRIAGRLYLKIDNQLLKVIDNNFPANDIILPNDSRFPIEMLAVAENQYVITAIDNPDGSGNDQYTTVYYYNRGRVTSFTSTNALIPGANFGEIYFVYPTNPVGQYLPKSEHPSYPDYYYPEVYNQAKRSTGYILSSYGDQFVAPYNKKWVRPINTRTGFASHNWLDLLRNTTYKANTNYPNNELSREVITTKLSLNDIAVMGFTPSTEIRAGTTSAVLGTFENPGTGWTQSQIEVRKDGVLSLLSVLFYRVIPVETSTRR